MFTSALVLRPWGSGEGRVRAGRGSRGGGGSMGAGGGGGMMAYDRIAV